MLLDLTTEETLALYHHLHGMMDDHLKHGEDHEATHLAGVYCKIDDHVLKKLQENTTDPVRETSDLVKQNVEFSEPSIATKRQFDKWYEEQLSKVIRLKMENDEITGNVRKVAKKLKKR